MFALDNVILCRRRRRRRRVEWFPNDILIIHYFTLQPVQIGFISVANVFLWRIYSHENVSNSANNTLNSASSSEKTTKKQGIFESSCKVFSFPPTLSQRSTHYSVDKFNLR